MPDEAVAELEVMIDNNKITEIGKYILVEVMPMCKGLEDL